MYDIFNISITVINFKMLPIPGLSRKKDQVLRQIWEWTVEFEFKNKNLDSRSRRYQDMVTTEKCAKDFSMSHTDMIKVLNRLEGYGYISKRRRQSGGINGHGYDGSLYSEILVSEKAKTHIRTYS